MFPYIIGDDWEHEEIFTDDDEAVGNDPEEREHLAPEIPPPPEIKQVFHIQVLCLITAVIMTLQCYSCSSGNYYTSHNILCAMRYQSLGPFYM